MFSENSAGAKTKLLKIKPKAPLSVKDTLMAKKGVVTRGIHYICSLTN